MVAVTQNDIVDCADFLNSIFIYRFDQIESKVDQKTQDLHGALYQIYDQIQTNDLLSLTMTQDYLLAMGFQVDAVVIKLKNRNQPFFAFDLKLSDGFLFLAAYYSIGNDFQKVCEKHGLLFSAAKAIWYKKIPLAEGEFAVQNAIFELSDFFNDIKQISRVFFYKSTMQKFFRVA